ncbi:calcium ATPase [Hesseltinella vesiculosa]|uniref:Calcium ATPase n=1 Tax=Hesseltinella vesiculosa TaxID=101127 RepID=A0A1X2GLR9_9FUNG|nr:calcium ATPase [Hesseltinella vesiculosa]
MSKNFLSAPTGHQTIDITSLADGKLSIEQQIELYVHDLFDVKDNKAISLDEVLEGLRYVMDYRIKGGYHPRLDAALMSRLCQALLLFTGQTQGHLLRKKPTAAADAAFFLFGDFLEEVDEFRATVGQKEAFELRQSLKLHHRSQSSSTNEQKRAALAMVQLLSSFAQLKDWHELVKPGEQDAMDHLLKSSMANEMKGSKHLLMPSVNRSLPHLQLPPPPALYFDRSVEKLLAMYAHTDPENGLPSGLVPSLRGHYGMLNKLPDPPKPNVFKMLWTQLTDFIILILLAAAIVEAGQQEFNSMAVLLIVVVLNTIIGFTQEWKASKTLNALMNLTVPKARVIRDGDQQMIDSEDLVPGDLVVLEEGDAIPADLRLIEVAQLEVIEGILTGESLPVQKTTAPIKAKSRRIPLGDCTGNAFMSTNVARGRAKAIVVRTGTQTEIGKISSAIQDGSKRKTKTPVQKKLAKLGKILVVIAVVLCALVVVIGVAWKKDARTMINVGLSLAVSVIPEGLVAVTTVTMALGVRRMATKQCIVRTLPAVESLGSVTVICSDKTGTLTEGKMGVAELWTADDTLYRFTESTSLDPEHGQVIQEPAELRRRMIHLPRPSGLPLPPRTSVDEKTIDYASMRLQSMDTTSPGAYPPLFRHAMMIAGLCNNASVSLDEETKTWLPVGDPTEIALTVACQKAQLSAGYWEASGCAKIHERAFDSDRKLMSSVYQQLPLNDITHPTLSLSKKDSPVTYWVLCKGAPEEVLGKCSHYYLPPTGPATIPPSHSIGSIASSRSSTSTALLSPTTAEQLATTPMNEDLADYVCENSSAMASQGLRVLGLALKKVTRSEPIDKQAVEQDSRLDEDNFVFVGLVGLMDPPKQGVKEAVATCQDAGIRVMMITGDHVDTATAIAEKLGIFNKDIAGMNRAILGRELDLLSEDALMELDPFPNVFARVSPDNKLTIVQALQKRGNIVAMTGDGVNDAPAIKSADVGIAMGIAGTEITKQAADLVLLDDNFATIVSAVHEGRHVFDNILKFIVYLLSCNGAEIFLMLFCAMADLETPLTTMQILWANIIADVPPSMALGVEPKEPDLMQRPPRPPTRGVLTRASWLIIFCQAMSIAGLTIAAYCVSLFYLKHSLDNARSVAFTCITLMQLVNSFTARSVQSSMFKVGIVGNRWLLVAFAVSFGFMLLGIYAPRLSDWLELTFVDGPSWAMILICCVLILAMVEFEKSVIRRLHGII